MPDGLEALIKKYGGAWEEARPQVDVPEKYDFASLFEGAPDKPVFMTPEEATQFGFTLEEGWQLKLNPPVDGATPTWSVISPDEWEITQSQEYISPEGEHFTKAEYEKALTALEEHEAFGEAFGAVFPEMDFESFLKDVFQLTELQAQVQTAPYTQEMLQPAIQQLEGSLALFYENLTKIGQTPATEELMGYLGASPEEITEFFQTPSARFMTIVSEGAPILRDAVASVFTGIKVDKMLEFALNDPDAFTREILGRGWTSDVENLLWLLYPNVSIDEFFPAMTEQAIEAWSDAPLFPDFDTWDECVSGFPGFMDLWNFFKPAKIGGVGIGVVGSYFDKYIMRPWEGAVLFLRAEFQWRLFNDQDAKNYLLRIQEIDKKWGTMAIYAEETHFAMENYIGTQPFYVMGQVELASWLNPVFFIPIGYGAGFIAKFTSTIPILGRSMKWTAAGVRGIETGIIYPIKKPIQLGVSGVERLGQRLGAAQTNRLIKAADHQMHFEELVALSDAEILDKLIVDNWLSRCIKFGARIPVFRRGIERGLGWRILAERNAQTVEAILGRGALLRNYFARMGVNIKNPVIYSMRSIVKNPVKYFGFNNQAYSQKMFRRLLPEHAGTANAGTFEHVFTHPEMYRWDKLGRVAEVMTPKGQVMRVDAGLKYVMEFKQFNDDILAMLKAQGIAPEKLVDDWVHRVVQREGGRLRRGKAIGAAQPYEKLRRFETMQEGIDWFMKHKELGAHYASNPETSLAEYIEQAFRRLADERFVEYVSKFEAIAGQRPAVKLLETFPELAQRAILRAEEFADTKYFTNAINRAIRGERLPEQTLRAVERRFPEFGSRFRALATGPAVGEAQLRQIIAQNKQFIDDLTARLRKAEAIDINAIRKSAVTEARAGLSDEAKMVEAFELMEYEDRLAFRSTMESQFDDVGRVWTEHSQELAGVKEWLASDPVAIFRVQMGNRSYSLTRFLREGIFPDTFTVNEARALMLGKQPTMVIQTGKFRGRVWAKDALDAVAERFHMSVDELERAVGLLAEQRVKANDLRLLSEIVSGRYDQIKRMMGILDDVEARLRNVPRPKPDIAVPAEGAAPELTPMPQAAQDELFIQAGRGKAGLSTGPAGLVYRDAAGNPVVVVTLFAEGEYVRVGAVVSRARGLQVGKAGAAILKELETIPNLRLPPRIEMSPAGAAIAEKFIARRPAVPKAEIGMPEAGIQRDLFGYDAPHFPKGKGQVTQISMDEYNRLVEYWRKAGLPEEDIPIALRPRVAGISGLETAGAPKRISFDMPPIQSAADRLAELKRLRAEIRALTEQVRTEHLTAKSERALRMAQIRQPAIGEGYIMQPFAGGKLYSEEFIDAFNKFFGYDRGRGELSMISDTAGILRITKAALDFSFQAIQGLPSWGLAHAYLMTNPEIGARMMGSWYRNFARSIFCFFDEGLLSRAIDNKLAISAQRIQYGGSSRAIMLFQEFEMAGLGRTFERATRRIPLTPYQRAERAWFAAGELVRNDFWEILYPIAKRGGNEFNLARSLDLMTGITDSRAMGVPLTMRQIEQSFIWFAPNYTRACLTFLADVFRGGYTGATARRALGGMVSAGIFYYGATQFSLSTLSGKTPEQAMEDVLAGFCVVQDPITEEWQWKPSARFMTIQIGNYHFGFGGFWYGLMRLSGNIMACINEVGEREIIDLFRIIKNGSFNNKDNPFVYWWYSRSSPFFGSVFEASTGRDFLGYPIEGWEEYLKYIATRFEPIWMEQGLNWLVPTLARENEIPEGAARLAVAPLELLGLRTFPEGAWVNFYDKANEYINKLPVDLLTEYFDEDELKKILEVLSEEKLKYEHLPEALKVRLLSMYDDLEELYMLAQNDSYMRNRPEWQAWQDSQDRNRDWYYEQGDTLVNQLTVALSIDTRELRLQWSDRGLVYGAHLDEMEASGVYDAVYEYLERKRAEGYKYEWDLNLALSEYIAIMFSEYPDGTGGIDWDARDEAIQKWLDSWGEDWYSVVRKMYADRRLQEGLNPILVKLAEDKDQLSRAYWDLPYQPIIDMTLLDAENGDIPEKYLALWETYQGLMTDEARAAFLENHPELDTDFRAEYRLAHPETDAMLALWGYGGKLQSMEAYNQVVKWGEELGIPLEQMGLGLPPQNLIEPYFEATQISMESGGNSAQMKLWKLQHGEYVDWAVEQGIWTQGTEGYKPEEFYELEIQWHDFDVRYEGLPEDNRRKFLEDNTEYHASRRRRDALGLEVPEDQIEIYVEWYVNFGFKQPDDWEYSYYFEPDWWLLDHEDFYNFMVDGGHWQARDFSKVPTREVWALYKKYLRLPRGKVRLIFRHEHRDLDKWLVFGLGYTPVGDRWQ